LLQYPHSQCSTCDDQRPAEPKHRRTTTKSVLRRPLGALPVQPFSLSLSLIPPLGARRSSIIVVHLGRVVRRKEDPDLVCARGIDLVWGQELVGEVVAGGAGVVVFDAVGDGDGEVEDGVVVGVVDAEVLTDGDLGDSHLC
jgi:hypothetical protein